jgi:AhpD family alkylhydroperoxidase
MIHDTTHRTQTNGLGTHEDQEKEEPMKVLFASLALTVLAVAPAAAAGAGNPPPFMTKTFPADAVQGAWQEYQAVMNPNGALDAKTKELIGLGVAAQIPCQYCVYYHTQAAKADGASEAEIKEAIATAALTRKWSTVLNGSAYDFNTFRQEVDSMFASN